MPESYEERRARLTQPCALEQEHVSGADLGSAQLLSAEESLPTSEARLDALDPRTWTPAAFAETAQELMTERRLVAGVYRRARRLPPLAIDSAFMLRGEYENAGARRAAGENMIVSVVRERRRVIGFGIGADRLVGSKFEALNVDDFATRSAGVQRELTFVNDVFHVGLAHALVHLLLLHLRRPVRATVHNARARYVCKCLGFVGASQRNPEFLELR